MQNSFNGDFDFSVSEILLAHKFSFSANSSFSGYANGRKVSGMVYAIKGSVLYRFENRSILLKAGEMLFLPKNISYKLENEFDKDFLHITVNIEIAGIDFNKIYDPVDDSFSADLLFEKLITVWSEKKQGYRPMAKALVYEILYKYFRNIEKKNRTNDYSKISPATRILDQKYRENIPISQIAEACGFSETHFRRIFSKNFGCSPTEYRLKKRITLAKELLGAGEFTVAETAAYTGFDDSSYFSRVFKLQTGFTPSDYLAKENKNYENQ